MTPTFTRQDLITFVIGLAAGLALEIGVALYDSEALFSDPSQWIRAMGAGALGAAGRYTVTYLAQKGFTRGGTTTTTTVTPDDITTTTTTEPDEPN